MTGPQPPPTRRRLTGRLIDETTEEGDVRRLLEVFVGHQRLPFTIQELSQTVRTAYPATLPGRLPILPRSVQSVSCNMRFSATSIGFKHATSP